MCILLKIVLDAKFKNDLGFESLDFIEVVMALEETFQIVVPADYADKFLTPRDATIFIHKKLTDH